MQTFFTRNSFWLGLAFAGCYLIASPAMAQDEPADEPVVSGQQVEMAIVAGDDLAAPMVFSTVTESNGDAAPKIRMSTFSAAVGSFTMGGPGGFMASAAPDSFSMLGDPSVQKDLELVGDQLKQVNELQKNFSEKLKAQIGDVSNGKFDPARMKGIGELAKRLRDEQQSQIKELLLPHQLERLEQISVQRHMETAGTAGALASEKLTEVLGITPEQKKRLEKRNGEIATAMQEKIQQVMDDSREELLQELTSEQRAKLKQMTGEKFKSVPQDWSDKVHEMRQLRSGPASKSKSAEGK